MSRRFGTAGLLFVAVVLLAALHDLGGRNLHDTDTSRWGQLAREMIRSGEWLVPTRYGELYVNKPVLYLWAVAGPSALVGEVTPFLVRLPSALGLILLVLSTTWWCAGRTGSREAARIAGLLVLSTYGLEWLGRAGRLDMMGAGLSVAAAALVDRAALGLGTRRTAWWAGLAVGAALLTKGPPLLLTPLAALLVPSPGRSLRERLRAARPLLVLGVGAALALLWFVPAVLQAGWEEYGRKLLVGQAAERIGGTIAQREAPWYYVLGLPLQAAPWGLLYLGAALAALGPRGRRILGPTAGLVLAGALLLLVFSLIPTKHHRYLAPVLPLLAMGVAWGGARWLGAGLSADWARHGKLAAWALALGAAGLLVAGAMAAGALAPVLVPAAGLAACAWAAARGGGGAPRRRRVVLCVLYAAVFVMLAQAVLRPRFHETQKERYNQRLADLRAEGVRVLIGPGMTPESVFHGAPDAQEFLEAGRPVPRAPGERLLVVCVRARIAEVRDVTGAAGRVLFESGGEYDWVILGFGYP